MENSSVVKIPLNKIDFENFKLDKLQELNELVDNGFKVIRFDQYQSMENDEKGLIIHLIKPPTEDNRPLAIYQA